MLLFPIFSSQSFYNFLRQVPFSSCKHTDWGQGQWPFQTPLYQKLTLSAVCHRFPPGHYQSSKICQLIRLSHHTLSATGHQFSNCWTTLPPSKPNPVRRYSLPSFPSPHYFQNGLLTARRSVLSLFYRLQELLSVYQKLNPLIFTISTISLNTSIY